MIVVLVFVVTVVAGTVVLVTVIAGRVDMQAHAEPRISLTTLDDYHTDSHRPSACRELLSFKTHRDFRTSSSQMEETLTPRNAIQHGRHSNFYSSQDVSTHSTVFQSQASSISRLPRAPCGARRTRRQRLTSSKISENLEGCHLLVTSAVMAAALQAGLTTAH